MIFRLINNPHGRSTSPWGKNTGHSAGAEAEITPGGPGPFRWTVGNPGDPVDARQNRCRCLAVAIDQLQKYFSMLTYVDRLGHPD